MGSAWRPMFRSRSTLSPEAARGTRYTCARSPSAADTSTTSSPSIQGTWHFAPSSTTSSPCAARRRLRPERVAAEAGLGQRERARPEGGAGVARAAARGAARRVPWSATREGGEGGREDREGEGEVAARELLGDQRAGDRAALAAAAERARAARSRRGRARAPARAARGASAPDSSHSRARGRISFAANCRTVSMMSCCSSVGSKSIMGARRARGSSRCPCRRRCTS